MWREEMFLRNIKVCSEYIKNFTVTVISHEFVICISDFLFDLHFTSMTNILSLKVTS